MSVLVMLFSLALIVIAGLVVDGGQQVSATRRAESAAAGAARAAAAAHASDPAGRTTLALAAGRRHLDAVPGVDGTITVTGDRVVVRTSAEASTTFLVLLGQDRVTAEARAEVILTVR